VERIDCLNALVPHIKDQLVVISLGRTAEEWATVCPRDGNMFSSGMGNHIPIALGLAKVLPHRQIIVLDTDGSVLMLLSALTTLGAYPAPNLKIFVFDNEAYEGPVGSQRTHLRQLISRRLRQPPECVERSPYASWVRLRQRPVMLSLGKEWRLL
jgi:thiamine pyrophosphate-dependent acetolactate synthase large subunit-like protein